MVGLDSFSGSLQSWYPASYPSLYSSACLAFFPSANARAQRVLRLKASGVDPAALRKCLMSVSSAWLMKRAKLMASSVGSSLGFMAAAGDKVGGCGTDMGGVGGVIAVVGAAVTNGVVAVAFFVGFLLLEGAGIVFYGLGDVVGLGNVCGELENGPKQLIFSRK